MQASSNSAQACLPKDSHGDAYALAVPSAVHHHQSDRSASPSFGDVRRRAPPGRVGFDVQEDTSPRQQLIDILTKKGKGSFLRGWRRELDRDGDLEISYQEFCCTAGRLGFKGDIHELFGLDGNSADSKLQLEEVSPEADKLFNGFREWAKHEFGGFAETFCALDAAGRGQITLEMFITACRRHHFLLSAHNEVGEASGHREASDEELTDIFCCLDVDFGGNISLDELIFLEKDTDLRELAQHTEKRKQKEKHLKLMAWAFFEDSKLGVRPTHRCAPRPWLSSNFEDLPILINHRRVERKRASYQKSLEARIAFMDHIRCTFGNAIRAWRVGLDPESSFEVESKIVRRFCRKADLKIDSAALWKSLDKDNDGVLRMEELYIRGADILASFQMWACQEFGTCASIWDCDEMVNARHRHSRNNREWSDKKVRFNSFQEVLKACNCPICVDADMMTVLFTSLDLHGCGFVERADLEWLDKWETPEWLCAQPDPEAWHEMREMMLRIYKHPLKAWRHLLDVDNSNNVCWVEFQDACKKLGFRGNIGGAWRVLNHHLSSSISMKEFDAESAHLLGSFKDWADTNFGSVAKAYKAIDESGTGHVTLAEFRRACHKLKYIGDCRLLFDCLDIDGEKHTGKRSISLKEVEFLDDWEAADLPQTSEEELVVQQALAAKKATRPLKTSSSLPALQMRSRSTQTRSSSGAYLPSPGDEISPMCADVAAASNGGRLTRASRMASEDRLHRTYHCLSKASGKSPKCARQLPKVSSAERSMAQTKTLPWLQKLLAIDRKMQTFSEGQEAKADPFS